MNKRYEDPDEGYSEYREDVAYGSSRTFRGQNQY